MSDTPQAQPSKAETMRALIDRLEQALQVAAGGKDENVQAVLQEMKTVMAPAA